MKLCSLKGAWSCDSITCAPLAGCPGLVDCIRRKAGKPHRPLEVVVGRDAVGRAGEARCGRRSHDGHGGDGDQGDLQLRVVLDAHGPDRRDPQVTNDVGRH